MLIAARLQISSGQSVVLNSTYMSTCCPHVGDLLEKLGDWRIGVGCAELRLPRLRVCGVYPVEGVALYVAGNNESMEFLFRFFE